MKKIISTTQAPQAIGPYSQAVVAGGLVFCSGMIAIDPATGELVLSDITAETNQVMTNVKALLEAAGSSLDHVVKCSIFMSDMAHYATINTVYASYFSSEFPAREAVAVKTLPRNVNVEISVIATLNS